MLAPVFSQNEISVSVLSQNVVLPQSEEFGFVLTPSGVLNSSGEVFKIVIVDIMTSSGVLNTPGGVFKIVIVDVRTPSGVLNTPGGVFKIVIVDVMTPSGVLPSSLGVRSVFRSRFPN
jgi:hypothetical protein